MSKQLRAGVIGLGKQAQEDHLPALLESRKANLVAVCDVDESNRIKVSDEYSVASFDDYIEMFNAVEMDFVIVAAPHFVHIEIVREAAARGIHILKEKPCATNRQELLEIINLCKGSKIELMTTLQRRFNPTYSSFFQLYEQIGTPFFLDVVYSTYVNKPNEGWRGQKSQAGGGCLLDMGYHMIDLIIWYLGVPSSVAATISCLAAENQSYDAEDSANLLLSWDSGLHGTMRISRSVPPKQEKFRLVGSRGIIEVERGSIRRLSSDGQMQEELSRVKSWGPAALSQLDYFCDVISGISVNQNDAVKHLEHISLIEAAYESAETGKTVNPVKYVLEKEYVEN